MPTFEPWTVVRVPFPFTDRPVRQWRPALVVSARRMQEEHGLMWVAMITSAENRRWQGDVAVSDLAAAGLPAASVVRSAKIATIDAHDAEPLGALPAIDRKRVARQLAAYSASAKE